ncbi:MAG: chemotaxis protein MotB [Gammaproteobacteria bacterium]|jgi:chemotaxis protein MotB
MSAKSLVDMFEGEGAENAWVVTFADMMTLILVFFILLYTLSEFEEKSFHELISSVSVFDGEGNQISVIDYATRSGRNPESLKVVEDMLGMNEAQEVIENLKPAIVDELESMIANTDLADSLDLAFDADQINLQIDGRYLFSSGKATLKDEAKVIFSNLAELFRQHADYRIGIQGHTDDQDIETVQFPSNWELSAVRATTVLRFFINRGIDPERMTATGYADFLPLVENSTPENRARNRRVEFVLEKDKNI